MIRWHQPIVLKAQLTGIKPDSTSQMIELSIVVPVYRCKGSLRELLGRLVAILPTIVTHYEIIFVDDACPEQSWVEIEALAAENPNVVGVKLTRNFGQHLAITAGLQHARGGHVVVMDGDLQDPPEAIPALWKAAHAGARIVYARRQSQHQSAARMSGGRLYFAFLKYISKWNIDPSYGTFTLLSRQVVDAYLEFSEPYRHYLFILYWLGFDGQSVDIDRHTREIGTSSYRFSKLLRHALQGVLFFSNSMLFPLSWAVLSMLTLSFVGLILSFFDTVHVPVVQHLWMFGSSLFGVFLACTILILGTYAAASFSLLKRRPLFIVEKRIGGVNGIAIHREQA